MSQRLTANHSLAEWLEHILSLHPSEIDLGLTRLRQVASQLNLTALPDSTVITVAGTNGKGTSCALLEQILTNAGYRVGVFSSPHIEHYRERVRIDGNELSDQSHVDAFTAIAAAQADVSLTFFEYSALGALWLFAQHRPDVVLLEVGLGGRLDATNVIDADLALITTIDLDHQDYLGDTRELVAVEKGGIMRANKPAVCGDPNPPLTLLAQARQLRANLVCRNDDFSVEVADSSWCFRMGNMECNGLPLPQIPVDNAGAVIAALQLLPLNVSDAAIVSALEQVSVPGRLESLAKNIVIDVAHNPQAARYLATWLAQQSATKIIAVCSMLGDKDMENSIAPLLPLVDQWLIAPLNVARAANAETMQQLLPQADCFDSVAAAFKHAIENASATDLVILFGSFYTVAQAKQYWRQRR
ncbi:bifunctional tetrahydrofolate synthase/dihydrofolate synthase [Ferrimonas lipolytica]|uniref:Dihydrofolate synthase/folylpolyglutamate synthase n=1 Tax=Ferrimonas lipolytica TaxID=2724191 RepID=A0A6H1UDJ4_9GAMM|nr:bifunctional tetrahydrofolate synthase/dihydrofolate synthase [Ferrimonas lipolytica]QIZ77177.1 bifunctional tetrahydrofolate synthase/dihydrofolate synthase [Ferrimonas lipolytica]